MSAEYSVAEVLVTAAEISDYGGTQAGLMLTAYAERIKADESAVPVGEVFGPKALSTMVALANPLPPGTKLFAHPPAQAAQVDGCTESNCPRCNMHPDHRGDMQHAGIGSYATAEPVTPDGMCYCQDGVTCPSCEAAEPVAQGEADGDRAVYEGAREDLLDWKGRAQRAEATLRSLGYVGVDASQAPTAEPVAQGEVVATLGQFIGCGGKGFAVTFSREDAERLGALPKGTKLYIAQPHAVPADLAEYLKDPANVHVMMLRGVIAIPSIRSIVHLRGEVPNGEDAQLARIAELQEQVATLKDKPAERVVDGMVLVPVEPTPKMLAAVAGMEISVRVAEDDTAEYPVPEDDCAEIYRNMLATAPSPGESA